MKTKWELFEEEVFNDLKNKYQNNRLQFIHEGGADPTTSDIKITGLLSEINIEVKSNLAQAGQFVVLLKNGQFEFSSKNKTTENTFTYRIIEHLNDNKKYYIEDKNTKIFLDKSILYGWVIDYYKNVKNCNYFITKYEEELVIIPTDRLDEYFDIRAHYRIKRSGSRNLSYQYLEEALNKIRDDFPHINNLDIVHNKGKYFVNPTLNLYEDYNAELSKVDIFINKNNSMQEVRVLSKISNSNVIFTLDLFNIINIDNKKFEIEIKKL